MKKLLIFTFIVSVATLVGLWSGKKVCSMMPSAARSSQALYSGMSLNASQTGSIRKLEDSFQKAADELCMKVCEERVNLLSQIKNGQISREEIEKKVEEIGQIQIFLEKQTATHILDINKILTPSQSAVYLERVYQQQCQMTAKSGHGGLGIKMENLMKENSVEN